MRDPSSFRLSMNILCLNICSPRLHCQIVNLIRQRIAGPLGGREAVSTCSVGALEKIVILLVSATCHILTPWPGPISRFCRGFGGDNTGREWIGICGNTTHVKG